MDATTIGAKLTFNEIPDHQLKDLLEQACHRQQNYESRSFICIGTIKELLTRERISAWSAEHPLRRPVDPEPEDHIQLTINTIHQIGLLVFTVLVLAEIEYLALVLLSHRFGDPVLFDDAVLNRVCNAEGLTPEEREKFLRNRSRVAVVFQNNQHITISKDAVLPYLKKEDLDRYGSFGVVHRWTLQPGHLEGYDNNIVAVKRIRASEDPSSGQWRFLYREVDTLRRKRHPSIVDLLASYYLDADESGSDVRTLHLVFPWADTDLEAWMLSSHTPEHLEKYLSKERQSYLHCSMYSLVSGLSYLHREIKGIFTSHHDVKPRNILVVNDQLKIADLGLSHLRSTLEGSETGETRQLGTYDYQPPEYWLEDGSRAKIRHGRAFDVWSMGCIILELTILLIDGWESQKVALFKKERRQNLLLDRQCPSHVLSTADTSFHNNSVVIGKWVEQLKSQAESQKLRRTLDVAVQMMAETPNRSPMWEAEVDLYEILTPDEKRTVKLGYGANSVLAFPRGQTRLLQTPLHRAVQRGNRTRVIQLLELERPIFVEDQNGSTARDILRRSNDIWLQNLEDNIRLMIRAAAEGSLQTIKTLLSEGLSPLLTSKDTSILCEAARYGQCDVIDYVLSTKAKKHLYYLSKGILPLHAAAQSGSVTAIKRILKDFREINICDDQGVTALYRASEGGHKEVVELLLMQGAQIFPAETSHPPSVKLRRFPDCGEYAEHNRLRPKFTALNAAVSNRREEILELLLGADDAHRWLEKQDEWFYTPLQMALQKRLPKSFRLLLQHGASLEAVHTWEGNCLHMIARGDVRDILEEHLHRFPTDLFLAKCRSEGTPYQIAKSKGHYHVARLLKDPPRNLSGSAVPPTGRGQGSLIEKTKGVLDSWRERSHAKGREN